MIEPVEIRPYEHRDYDAISRVCLLTAEAGANATGLYVSDDLMPDIFARPYVVLEPELAFVVEDEHGVGGYILGVADTRSFVRRFAAERLPEFRLKYEHTEPVVTRDDLIRHLGFTPERMLLPEVDEFPAHLHIDLLPRLQGRGLGRSLIRTLVEALQQRGVPGLHLTLDAANTGARAFYDRLGFTPLGSSTDDAPALGLRL